MGDKERIRDYLPPRLWAEADLYEEQQETVQSALEDGDFDVVRTTVSEMDLSLTGVWGVIRDKLVEGSMTEATANEFIDTVLDAKPDYFKGDEDVDLDHGRAVGHVVGLLGRIDIIDRLIVPDRGETTDGTLTAAGIVQGLGHQSNDAGFTHIQSKITHFPQEYRLGIEAQFAQGLPAQV